MTVLKDIDIQALLKPLEEHLPLLYQAADTIRERDISKYPILVLHRQAIELGVLVSDAGGDWSVSASTLEEFAMKQLIRMERIEDFQGVYKDPDLFLCLFVVLGDQARFAFLPRSAKAFQHESYSD